ncbi:MAG: hypothetical protein LBB40_05510, partial [Holophagales bacterium]|nr:hypothetical protein [Holophagales bacterium]
MRIRYACIALLVFTTMPALTEDTTWRHCVGLRVGGVGIIPFSYSLATFHEAQSYRNLAIRSALETTNGKEWTIYGDMGYGIDISRVGAAVDFIYYTSYERPIGTGFFTMAGIGAHRFDIKDQMFQNVLSDRQTAASFSLGIGYVGKKFGVELKRYMSNQDSAVAAGIGRDWFQTSMIFRFPMPGQAKVEFARDVNWSAKKNAEKIAEENESIQSAPQH